ncbi:10471_t:CDS:1, partial [Funneliformis geosporum]
FKKTIPSGNNQSHVTSVEPDLTEQDNDELIPEESLDRNQIVE